jgi:hypothetical protein
MIYPIDYTEDDKIKYDNYRKLKLVEYGNNPKDYDAYLQAIEVLFGYRNLYDFS